MSCWRSGSAGNVLACDRCRYDIEHRTDRPEPYRARVRWIDPTTKRRKSKSQACSTEQTALDWIAAIRRVAEAGTLLLALVAVSLFGFGKSPSVR